MNKKLLLVIVSSFVLTFGAALLYWFSVYNSGLKTVYKSKNFKLNTSAGTQIKVGSEEKLKRIISTAAKAPSDKELPQLVLNIDNNVSQNREQYLIWQYPTQEKSDKIVFGCEKPKDKPRNNSYSITAHVDLDGYLQHISKIEATSLVNRAIASCIQNTIYPTDDREIYERLSLEMASVIDGDQENAFIITSLLE